MSDEQTPKPGDAPAKSDDTVFELAPDTVDRTPRPLPPPPPTPAVEEEHAPTDEPTLLPGETLADPALASQIPFVIPGKLGTRQTAAVAGAILLVAATIDFALADDGMGMPSAALTLYFGAVGGAVGTLALWFVAKIENAPLTKNPGLIPLAAARMLLAVAIFQCVIVLKVGIPGRIIESLAAIVAYWFALGFLFALPGMRRRNIALMHGGLMTVIVLGLYIFHWAMPAKS